MSYSEHVLEFGSDCAWRLQSGKRLLVEMGVVRSFSTVKWTAPLRRRLKPCRVGDRPTPSLVTLGSKVEEWAQ